MQDKSHISLEVNEMSSNKPRIATYTTESTVRKFKILAAYNNMSMSELNHCLILNAIEDFESEHGEITISDIK